MARNKVKISGLTEFNKFTEELAKEIELKAKEIVRDTTLDTEREAKLLAPVDTGYLREQIKSTFENNGFTGIVTSNAEYSIFVEFGTSKQQAQPFLFPTYHKKMDDFIRELKELVRRAGG